MNVMSNILKKAYQRDYSFGLAVFIDFWIIVLAYVAAFLAVTLLQRWITVGPR